MSRQSREILKVTFLGHPVHFRKQNMMTESNFLGTQPPLKMSLHFCIESKKREKAGCQLEVQQAGASFATFQTASKKRPRLSFS